MALDIRLSNASYLIELDDSSPGLFGVRLDGDLGMPDSQRVYSESWGRGFSPLAAIDYRARVINLVMRLQGTSLDNWIVNFRQIEAILLQTRLWWTTKGLQGDAATLSVQLNNMTYPLEFDVLDGDCNAQAIFDTFMLSSTNPQLLRVELPLRVKPFGHPQALTRVTSASLLNGGGVSATNPGYALTAPKGDVATPLKITFQAAAGDDIRRVIIGKKLGNTTANFPFALNCETGTGPGYTVTSNSAASFAGSTGSIASTGAAVATAHGASVYRINITSASPGSGIINILNWEITSGLINYYGKHRVFLRGSSNTYGNDLQGLRWSYGGSSGDDIVLSTVTAPNFNAGSRLADLGVMQIPHRQYPLDNPLNSYKMKLGARWTSVAQAATRHLDLDCIYLMPIDGGYFDGEISAFSSTAVANRQVVIDALQQQARSYVLDPSGDIEPQRITPYTNTYFNAEPGLDNLFYVLYGDTTNFDHDLSDAYTLKFEYQPWFALARDTT